MAEHWLTWKVTSTQNSRSDASETPRIVTTYWPGGVKMGMGCSKV